MFVTSRVLSLASVFALALPAVARAQDVAPPANERASTKPPVLRPGTRSMVATFAIAPALALDNSLSTQVKLAEGFAWHPSGDSSGLAFGGELQESLGGSAFVFAFGPKAWYDFQVSDDYGIYLAPCAMLGMMMASASGYTTQFAFDMQFGFEAKLLLQDRGMVFFRPITLDIAINDNGAAARWDLVFGGGVTF